MSRPLIVLLSLTLLFTATSNGQQDPAARDPEQNFEYLWNALDRNYAQFGVKHVDWDALYRVYRPRVTPETSDGELWDIMLAMMRHLNDSHVCLSDEARRICVGLVDELERDDFSLDLVRSKYLQGESTDALDGSFTYGWLPGGIGYLHIADFKDGADATVAAIDEFLAEFARADAIILDVRNNPGGTGAVANLVADRFADRKRQFMRSRVRYGRSHDDLDSLYYRHVEPRGAVQFTGPTILLTHRFTESAADIFVLAMRVLPHVTVVGDFTAGAFSSQYPDALPNGWTLWVAFKVMWDHMGICWDGIGVPPDLRIKNTKEDVGAGVDRVLEFAIDLLEKGDPIPQEEAGSLANLKTSLVAEFAKKLEAEGLEAALAELDRARRTKDDTHFLAGDEIIQQANRYARTGQNDAAIAILRVCREEFPHVASVYGMLAQAYLGIGDVEAAETILREGEAVEPMFPWERQQIGRVTLAVQKEIRGAAASVVGQVLAEEGIERAEEVLRELLSKRDSGPIFDERDFNLLGYQLLQGGDHDAAIFVFEKNVELYPDSWNAYDSLGEALVGAGQRERAIANYRRSVELNPSNANGKTMLGRLEGER
jgi:tetratricopeptide (TPR) repeat protein